MSKLDERGLAVLIEEIDKSINTKINGMGATGGGGGGDVDLSNYVTKEEISVLEKSVLELKKTDGELANLKTTNKTNLVSAINELFQDVDSGKQLIATAIDSSNVTKDSTFEAMGEAIGSIRTDIENTRNTLADLMFEGGYDITGDEDINSLLDLLVLSGISVSDIKQIACGQFHTVALKRNGSVWVVGYNASGQLGLNNTTSYYTSFKEVTTNIYDDVKQVSCGYNHSFILKKDGTVWACGTNGSGQLGLNSTTDKKVFTKVTTNINNDVKQVYCKYNQTFVIKNDNSLWACGLNSSGQLGLGDTTNKTTFTKVTTDVKQVACGTNHVFVLKNDGTVYACGYNSYGQLGLGDSDERTSLTKVNIDNVKEIHCGEYHTAILKNDGSLWTCGLNNNGQLGAGDNTNRNVFTQVVTGVKKMFCNHRQTFIVKNNDTLYGCGRNNVYQLGIMNTTDQTSFAIITTDVKDVYIGETHTFILKNDGVLYCCGYEYYGQLGMGTSSSNITTPTEVIRGF